ncbi:MAG: GNAT family N-acetyltransferase [Ilumatobacteraceae bacterium]
MELIERQLGGFEYLAAVTGLLQRIRLDSADGGLWEAADIQWAWRRDQHVDPAMATFWTDASGIDVAAVVIMDWGDRLGCELLVPPEISEWRPAMWRVALDRLESMRSHAAEVSVRDDDTTGIDLVTADGFVADGETAVSCWLEASQAPPVSDLAPGYRLLSRADAPASPHHMISRNGDLVAERLLECSLYNPAFDLYVESPEGSVAAYGLFWPDPVTGVGLVEPMRTEDAHQNRGVARHVLTAGLSRLAAAGSSRFKITFMDSNPTSKHVYLSSGFVPNDKSRVYLRPAIS